MRKVLLVGNPNCGKTTLFNSLTGSAQRIGNWPGVTVEKKQGYCDINGQKFEIIDLPGVYALNVDDNSAQDSIITAREVINHDVDVIINVVDACHLERHMYLTTQLLELKIPLIMVVNMVDLAKNRQIFLNQHLLAKKLDCPVVFMQANKKLGMEDLYRQLAQPELSISNFQLSFSDSLQNALQNIIKKNPSNRPLRKISSASTCGKTRSTEPQCTLVHEDSSTESTKQVEAEVEFSKRSNDDFAYFKACRQLENTTDNTYLEDVDILMADARYTAIHKIVSKVQNNAGKKRDNFTAKIDNIVLNRFFALPIFIGIMYVMFLFAINLGSVFRDFFDVTTDAIFVKGVAYIFAQINSPSWFVTIFANGIGRGINTTASFIPVIFLMYLFLSLLELSGYMARAAFIIDRLMRLLGLPGKSFVPMIVGLGCNVPGIMAARTLEKERDRILTVVMSPFMSCSARLTIYVVFVSAFYPQGGQNIVFSLYCVGILMAVFTGFVLKKTILSGEYSPLIIELPSYHLPPFSYILKDTYTRLRVFLVRAGKLIIPVCILLSIMENWQITINGEVTSIIAYFGKKLAPAFAPMGISTENWPAVVGLITGTLAKEVVVGTLNTLYSHLANLNQEYLLNDFNLFYTIKEAFFNLYTNIVNFKDVLGNPIAASANNTHLSASAYGVMVQSFHSKIAAYAYLLFVLLYIPCVSTMAAIKQETNHKYMWFAIIWSIVLAYVSATTFYQLASWYIYLSDRVKINIYTLMIILALVCIGLKTNLHGRKTVTEKT